MGDPLVLNFGFPKDLPICENISLPPFDRCESGDEKGDHPLETGGMLYRIVDGVFSTGDSFRHPVWKSGCRDICFLSGQCG